MLQAEVEKLRNADKERQDALAAALASSNTAIREASAERSISSRAVAYDRASKALVKATAITAGVGPSPHKAGRIRTSDGNHESPARGEVEMQNVSEEALLAKAAHSTDKLPYATEEHRYLQDAFTTLPVAPCRTRSICGVTCSTIAGFVQLNFAGCLLRSCAAALVEDRRQ